MGGTSFSAVTDGTSRPSDGDREQADTSITAMTSPQIRTDPSYVFSGAVGCLIDVI